MVSDISCERFALALALKPPFSPMEARSVAGIPTGPEWQYEPKWDGFRCLVFRDRRKVELQSKAGQPLTRYFPDLVEAVLAVKAEKFVLDGEILVPSDGAFSFDALLQRIHPAPSRVQKLARETPALLFVFDLLLGEDSSRMRSVGSSASAQRSTASSPSGATSLINQASAPACRRSRITAAPTAWSAAFATTKASRWWVRCCLAFMTARACCITSDLPRRSNARTSRR